ncbi:hypothetical protein ACFXTH_004772 [Malus domestica]
MQESSMSAILLVLLLFVLHLQSGVHSLAPPHAHHFGYLKFVYNATDLPLGEKYDYIVVGGGTSGCPLAATLSAKYSVLVLERGSLPTAYPNLLNQDGFLYNLYQEDDGNTPVQGIMSEDVIPTERGRILGGTSMINAGVHARANISFYNESGIEWDMDLVNKTYKWVENTIVGDELLNKGDPNNLRVAVHATVEKIIFSTLSKKSTNLSATGVIYRDSNGRSNRALVHDKGEIILSSGTIASPQLLLLSGIGPKSYLSSLKIPVVLDLPDVGQFMYDNPRNFINILTPNDPLEPSIVTSLAITNNFYQCSISLPPYTTPAYSLFPSSSYPLPNSTFAHFLSKVPGPLSHGSLTLNSSFDVTIPPNVKFNYFSDSTDLANCVAIMKSIGNWHRIGIATADALLGRWLMAVCVLRESTHYVLLIRPHSLRTGETPSGLLFDVGQVYGHQNSARKIRLISYEGSQLFQQYHLANKLKSSYSSEISVRVAGRVRLFLCPLARVGVPQ